MTQNLNEFLHECVEAIDKELDELLPPAGIEPQKLHAAMRWSIFAGGKRLRSALLIAVGKVFDAPDECLIKTASAIEMIHTYSLIHDDLPAMDNDSLRRGTATCHVKFGEATAILAGDTLQNLAFLTIADDEALTPEIRLRLISEIAHASGSPNGMVAGQQMDLDAEGESGKVSVEKLERIHLFKTGAMISVAARSGAIIAGADDKEIKAVSKYAAYLGLLFQITDDILDVTQTTEILGKTAGKDASSEKATYPAIFGMEKTKLLAFDLFERSCKALKGGTKNFNLLREIAEHIYTREN
jgi:geranylgeranyl pyrophosphate synthase